MSDHTPQDQSTDRPPSLAAAISVLLNTMPAVGAPATERIAWFEHKAAVLDRIADDPCSADSAEAARLAANARRMAQTLRNKEAGR